MKLFLIIFVFLYGFMNLRYGKSNNYNNIYKGMFVGFLDVIFSEEYSLRED